MPIRGFITEEIRERGERVGFRVETLAGERATLAHVNLPGPPRVGRYGVDVAAFEAVALPALDAIRDDDVVIIDEIGKMELASRRFRDRVMDAFARRVRVVATIQLAHDPFTDARRERADVEVVRVTTRQRDRLPRDVVGRLR